MYTLRFPNSLEEQTQIGNFFKQLDDTIALHQQEVEKIQKNQTILFRKDVYLIENVNLK
nr:restriction endonuclease subunit S [Haemophilus parahaemolyticus]